MPTDDLELSLDALTRTPNLRDEVKQAIAEGPEASYAYATYNELNPHELTALERAVMASPEWASHFARDVPGADVPRLLEAVCRDPKAFTCCNAAANAMRASSPRSG